MQQVGIGSFKELGDRAGVSRRQLRYLKQGEIGRIRLGELQKLAAVLEISLTELIEQFVAQAGDSREDYRRIQGQIQQQQEGLREEFQRESLATIESWLLQWQTVKAAVEKNPDLSAEQIIPLVQPVEELMAQWGIEAIASVGEEVPFDPKQHQLLTGTAEVGERVRVRYAGFRWREKLLYRAKVSPV